ncbi:MAG TPA: BPSS1780 family membrane protein [Burkholderiales bacterium]|nr:BPSS1780 family membrane protein [Burkholderiales bacterium]
MNIEKVPASHGLKWVVQGLVLLRRNFFVWVLFVLLLWALVFVSSRLPFAGLALAVLTPVFLGGLMIGARAVEKGDELEITHLFAGFRTHTLNLLAVGAFYLVGNVVIVMIMGGIGGEAIERIAAMQGQEMDPEALAKFVGPAMMALLVGMALSVPLTMAVWFAPLLVVFQDEKPAPALRQSFGACLRNMLPFFVYGLVIFVPLVLLMLPFNKMGVDRNPGLWIVALLVLPSIYTSYRDIFRDASGPEAPAATPAS